MAVKEGDKPLGLGTRKKHGHSTNKERIPEDLFARQISHHQTSISLWLFKLEQLSEEVGREQL